MWEYKYLNFSQRTWFTTKDVGSRPQFTSGIVSCGTRLRTNAGVKPFGY